MIENGKQYLVTTDAWFYGPDGHQYRGAYGECTIVTTDEVFGFKPSRPSTNWFLKVGTDDNHVILAGCQIHYAIRADEPPAIRPEKYNNKDTGIPMLANAILIFPRDKTG